MKASTRRRFKRSDIEVTKLGMGSAPLGGLYAPVSVDDARSALEAAWNAGIRYFDTAPMYGRGRSEHLVGELLRSRPAEDGFRISTKVGRLMTSARPGRVLPPEAPPNEFDSGWHDGLPFVELFDYSYDGIMRSFDDSQQRTGLKRFDILYVHDIGRVTHGAAHDAHWSALTRGGGFQALAALRQAGLVDAIGLGVNEWEVIRDAMEEIDLDCCLLAGRYTLLDQGAAEEFLPLARARDVDVVIGGVFNSGILAGVGAGPAKFDYVDAPPAIIDRVQRIAAICARHDTPLAAAAIQFPIAHPAVTAILIGGRTALQVQQAVTWFETPIPPGLWADLRAADLTQG